MISHIAGQTPGRYGTRRSSPSCRDVKELLAERGIDVDHVTVCQWIQRFTPLLIDAARHADTPQLITGSSTRPRQSHRTVGVPVPGNRQFRQGIDVLVSERRNLNAARRFLSRALEHSTRSTEVSTGRAPAYPRVLDEVLPAARHVVEQYANNSVEPATAAWSLGCGRCKSEQLPQLGVISAGHAFVQNLRRGHYELATHADLRHRLPAVLPNSPLAI